MSLEDVLGIPLNVLILCLLAGGTRVAVAVEPMSARGVLGIVVSSVFLGAIVYPLLTDEEYGKGLITLLVAIGSFAAKDLLGIVQKLFKQLRHDPLGLLREFLVKYAPKPTKLDEDK